MCFGPIAILVIFTCLCRERERERGGQRERETERDRERKRERERNCFFFFLLIILFINILKRDPLEIQHPTFENSRLGLIEPVHKILVGRCDIPHL